ncbi:MAG TPA: tetratricopeptide repeat protein [Terriglobia bacterium]|nr:tetratricopeptide repeat protein [Terriglobia bacterium]
MDEATRKKELAIRLLKEAYKHQMNGELEEAVEGYKKSIEACPTAEAYTFLGWTYSFMGRIDDAIAECHKAIEVDPTFGNPYNDIGAYLIQKGEIDEAIPWLERALQAPRYESYCFPHMNLGRAFESKRDWLRAREEYRKALAENADYKDAARGLARIRGYLN